MHYLVGCFRGPTSDTIHSIPVPANNFDLAWFTLVSRFHHPCLVATALIDKLSTQETLHNLNNFIPIFAESISLLNALKIQDHRSFIIFSMAFRCLPPSTRKLFESSASPDFPSVNNLLTFVQFHVATLEIARDYQKRYNNRSHPAPHSNAFTKKMQINRLLHRCLFQNRQVSKASHDSTALECMPSLHVGNCCHYLSRTVTAEHVSTVIYTKQGLLSMIVRIFDPLGLFAQAIFYSKCIMQRTWSAKITWDEPLLADIHHDWSIRKFLSFSEWKVPWHFNCQHVAMYVGILRRVAIRLRRRNVH